MDAHADADAPAGRNADSRADRDAHAEPNVRVRRADEPAADFDARADGHADSRPADRDADDYANAYADAHADTDNGAPAKHAHAAAEAAVVQPTASSLPARRLASTITAWRSTNTFVPPVARELTSGCR